MHKGASATCAERSASAAASPHFGSVARRGWISGLVIAALAGSAGQTAASIWGVKTHDPFTGPPSTLFRLEEDGSALSVVDEVRLAGEPVTVDGLALDPTLQLYGFLHEGTSSRLVTIDSGSAVAASVGVLGGELVWGAAFTPEGALIALADDVLIVIDPTTAQPVGPPVPLTLNGSPFSSGNGTDVAIDGDGRAVLSKGTAEYFAVDLQSGILTNWFVDSAVGSDGFRVFAAGLAWPSEAADGRLFVYDVNGAEDIFTYDGGPPFTRSLVYPAIIGWYNAGRGDLASFVAQPLGFGEGQAAPQNPATIGGHPNPFRSGTTLSFSLSRPGMATLTIYSSNGARVAELLRGDLDAGDHELTWTGRDERGRLVLAGVYWMRLVHDGQVRTSRLITLR